MAIGQRIAGRDGDPVGALEGRPRGIDDALVGEQRAEMEQGRADLVLDAGRLEPGERGLEVAPGGRQVVGRRGDRPPPAQRPAFAERIAELGEEGPWACSAARAPSAEVGDPVGEMALGQEGRGPQPGIDAGSDPPASSSWPIHDRPSRRMAAEPVVGQADCRPQALGPILPGRPGSAVKPAEDVPDVGHLAIEQAQSSRCAPRRGELAGQDRRPDRGPPPRSATRAAATSSLGRRLEGVAGDRPEAARSAWGRSRCGPGRGSRRQAGRRSRSRR